MDITCSAKLHWADKQNIFQLPAFTDHKISFIWVFVWMLLYLQSFHSFLFCMSIVSVFSKYSFIISYSLQIQEAVLRHVERDHMQLWNLSTFIDCKAGYHLSIHLFVCLWICFTLKFWSKEDNYQSVNFVCLSLIRGPMRIIVLTQRIFVATCRHTGGDVRMSYLSAMRALTNWQRHPDGSSFIPFHGWCGR